MKWFRKYLSIPFKDKGRLPDGCDCYGLLRIVYANELGILLPDLSDDYAGCDDQSAQSLIEFERTKWAEIEHGKQQPFDAAVIRLGSAYDHVGVVIDNRLLLNTTRASGVHVVEYRKSTPFWNPKMLGGFYRWQTA